MANLGDHLYTTRNGNHNHPMIICGSILHLLENTFDRKLFPLTLALTLTLTNPSLNPNPNLNLNLNPNPNPNPKAE